MKATEASLTFLREKIIYIIPYFQRGYVWDIDNWQGIWMELTAHRQDCFLGSIILKEEEYPGHKETCKTVIDGQQRLTTLTILLRALLDYYIQNGADENTQSYFKELIFYRSTDWLGNFQSRTTEICRIEHSRINRADYTSVIEGNANIDSIELTDTHSSRILRCYKYFTDCLQSASIDDIYTIRDKLISDNSKILVVIDLNQNENEQIIFDTINSTGVKLTASDIIKNALFQNIRSNPQKRDTTYETYWQKQFEEDENTIEEWLQLRGLGQNQRSYIDLFFYCFAIIKGFYNVQTDRIADLATKYKNHVKNFTIEQTVNFIIEICDYAKEYKSTFMEFDALTSYRFADDKNRLMQLLDAMKITAFDAFILFVVKNYDTNKQIAEFKNLERYVLRHYIIGNSSKMGSFTTDAAEMINGSFSFESKLSDPSISDDRFEASLKNISSNNKAKLLLFWVELKRHTKKESDLFNVLLNYAYELEHIMPQSWKEYWGLDVLPITDEQGNPISTEEAEKKRNDAIYQIGNMTLLTSKLNKKLQNHTFVDKVNGTVIEGKHQDGMIEYSSLSITKEVISISPLIWNEHNIENRTNSLISEIKDIWPCTPIDTKELGDDSTSSAS